MTANCVRLCLCACARVCSVEIENFVEHEERARLSVGLCLCVRAVCAVCIVVVVVVVQVFAHQAANSTTNSNWRSQLVNLAKQGQQTVVVVARVVGVAPRLAQSLANQD